jgi:hypothetical protein
VSSPVFPAPLAAAPTRPAEASALQKVMLFGILQLVGLASGLIGTFLYIGNAFGNFAPASLGPNPTPAQVSAALGPFFTSLALLVPGIAAVQIVAIVVLIMAFRQLKGVDRRFSVPTILTMVLLVGMVLAVFGAIPLFNLLPNLIAQATSVSGTTIPAGFLSAVAALVVYFYLVAIGGILLLIGLAGGQILGLWRVGSKYGETILKLGAIFVIIPVLNIAAPILVIIGAHQAKGRIAI